MAPPLAINRRRFCVRASIAHFYTVTSCSIARLLQLPPPPPRTLCHVRGVRFVDDDDDEGSFRLTFAFVIRLAPPLPPPHRGDGNIRLAESGRFTHKQTNERTDGRTEKKPVPVGK